MNIENDQERLELTKSNASMLKTLKRELEQLVTDGATYIQRMRTNDDTRFCLWDGQSDDGRKHEEDMGDIPFPWENASDMRPMTCDMVINEHVMVMMSSFFQGNIQVIPTDTNDMALAPRMKALLKWLMFTQMLKESARETELVAQWQQQYGSSVLGTWWERETRWK
jgi:hypothetical protein